MTGNRCVEVETVLFSLPAIFALPAIVEFEIAAIAAILASEGCQPMRRPIILKEERVYETKNKSLPRGFWISRNLIYAGFV